jgi:hypothetical protein
MQKVWTILTLEETVHEQFLQNVTIKNWHFDNGFQTELH